SKEAPALLAGQTESLTPVAYHGHEEEQHVDPQVLPKQKKLAALVMLKAYLVSSYASGPRSDQNSGFGPPLCEDYARFLEEEWANDATLLVPREEAEDDITHDMTAGEERRA
nr:hypothetical protein [Tanacetum cinerariifolium]